MNNAVRGPFAPPDIISNPSCTRGWPARASLPLLLLKSISSPEACTEVADLSICTRGFDPQQCEFGTLHLTEVNKPTPLDLVDALETYPARASALVAVA